MANLKVSKNIFFLIFATAPVLTAVVKENENSCSIGEVSCDGLCINANRVCDGIQDCADHSDESGCDGAVDSLQSIWYPTLNRTRRQASKCRRSQWQCRDGSCIGFDGKCDGVVDCPDGSDETHPLCRSQSCHSNWFRCTYGACVDGTAPCNGVQECADNSDELLPRCRNETDEIRGQFRCLNGQLIDAAGHCDGVADCSDGSDETVRTCAAKTCPGYLFQCAYGACVDNGADCNGVQECADGSDESDELCNRISAGTTTTTTTKRPVESGVCVLPEYPAHGGYTVAGAPGASPGKAFDSYSLQVTCNPGYGLEVGDGTQICFNGFLSPVETPKCIRFCKLSPHPSVEYRCILNMQGAEGTRPCREYEPHGTRVRPVCRRPNYYPGSLLNDMECVGGDWNHVAYCTAECGRITPDGDFLIIDGRNAKRGELPWHTGIYQKTTNPYMQICGGSLISTRSVISAAHCFWKDVKLPASNYAIAVGKLYRPWNDPMDVDNQKSDVSEIKIPARFQGATSNFQDDIAVLILTTVIEYRVYVRPVCLDFDVNFNKRQLRDGNLGKVAGWGLTSENGAASPILKVVDFPSVDIEKCLANVPPEFREYITVDKICAGYYNGTALCKGDSGGGLAFAESERGVERYYLRGVVSTAPRKEVQKCNPNTLTTFTQILSKEHFIKESIILD